MIRSLAWRGGESQPKQVAAVHEDIRVFEVVRNFSRHQNVSVDQELDPHDQEAGKHYSGARRPAIRKPVQHAGGVRPQLEAGAELGERLGLSMTRTGWASLGRRQRRSQSLQCHPPMTDNGILLRPAMFNVLPGYLIAQP